MLYIVPGQAFFGLDIVRGRGMVQLTGRMTYEKMPVEDPAQRDPPKKRHHDHLIERHVRTHQHGSRKP